MTAVSQPRSHLVERALAAAGKASPAELLDGTRPALPSGGVPEPPPAPSLAPVPAPEKTPPRVDVDAATLVKSGLVVLPRGDSRSRLSEEITLIQHQVVRSVHATTAEDGHCERIVLVTSARPAEGKSFASLNLAASIALGGTHQVVLVDADGKAGSLSDLLGCSRKPGLRSLASEPSLDPGGLLLSTDIPGLRILPRGVSPAGRRDAPPGAMLSQAVARLASTRPDDIIILDTPPCLSTSDPSTYASIAGQVLMVVLAESTQRSEVEAALDMVDACPVLRLMLNRVQMTTP